MCRLEQHLATRDSREREGEAEGKIEARSTCRGLRPCLHVGLGGTRPSRRGAPGWAKCLEGEAKRRASPAGLRWSPNRGSL